MKKIFVKVMYTLSEVMVPDYIANDIKKYRQMFFKWLEDKDNNHGYWYISNGYKTGLVYDITAFIDYLNKYVVKEKKDKVNKRAFSEICVEEDGKAFKSVFKRGI